MFAGDFDGVPVGVAENKHIVFAAFKHAPDYRIEFERLGEAVLAGDAPDATDELRVRIARQLGQGGGQ